MPIDAREQERRRTLIAEHYAAENDHDLDRLMDTFADDAVMHYNHQPFEGDEGIRGAHILIGMSASPGSFRGVRAVIDAEHYTDQETRGRGQNARQTLERVSRLLTDGARRGTALRRFLPLRQQRQAELRAYRHEPRPTSTPPRCHAPGWHSSAGTHFAARARATPGAGYSARGPPANRRPGAVGHYY